MRTLCHWQRWGSSALLLISLAACADNQQRVASRPTLPPTPRRAATPSPAVPTPTFVPVDEAAASTATNPPRRPPQISGANGATIRLEDTDWQGGYRGRNNSIYGGRTATWIYGTSTQYSIMQATFELDQQPIGTVELSVEGMDSEGPNKTPIQMTVNGVEIYRGLDPLPDDDQPLATGNWGNYTWRFNAQLLKPGANVIAIKNLAVGAFSLPPFFMLDYADLTYEAQ